MIGLLALPGVAGCALNEAGNLASTQQGDTSRPAARSSPLAELTAACGEPAITPRGEEVLAREPYLQQVTTSSAKVGWVTSAPAGARVEVTRPDGSAVTTASAVVEPGAVPTAGDSLVWSSVAGLEPATLYCYAVSDATGPLSSRLGFRTAPAADSTAPIRILAFGDSGTENGADQLALLDQMHTVPYELIIHTGDLAYDSGTFSQLEDYVFGVYKELFRHVPFVPTPGNHDYETDDGAPFRKAFALPSNNERWYSYDWGRIHFATIDTEADYASQAAWLDRDLAASTAPWKIVYLHRPPYSSGAHGSELELRAALAPVLERHGVQLVLAGHDHHYERMHTQGGVDYIVTGGGGRGTRTASSSPFTALSEEVIHLVYLEVGVDELVVHAIDGTGAEFDSLVVPRVRAPN